jgi:hypothetical protein
MSEIKLQPHAPGEWKFLAAFGRVETDRRVICYIAGGTSEIAMEEAMLNGKLIAAAPELKEVCSVALTEFMGLAAYLGTCAEDVIIANLKSTIASLEGKIEVLSRVIRKAEGESQ